MQRCGELILQFDQMFRVHLVILIQGVPAFSDVMIYAGEIVQNDEGLELRDETQERLASSHDVSGAHSHLVDIEVVLCGSIQKSMFLYFRRLDNFVEVLVHGVQVILKSFVERAQQVLRRVGEGRSLRSLIHICL